MNSRILLVESLKLVSRFLNKGPRPKSGKLKLNYMAPILEGKINWFGPKNGV
jgi:hypothetical protein